MEIAENRDAVTVLTPRLLTRLPGTSAVVQRFGTENLSQYIGTLSALQVWCKKVWYNLLWWTELQYRTDILLFNSGLNPDLVKSSPLVYQASAHHLVTFINLCFNTLSPAWPDPCCPSITSKKNHPCHQDERVLQSGCQKLRSCVFCSTVSHRWCALSGFALLWHHHHHHRRRRQHYHYRHHHHHESWKTPLCSACLSGFTPIPILTIVGNTTCGASAALFLIFINITINSIFRSWFLISSP